VGQPRGGRSARSARSDPIPRAPAESPIEVTPRGAARGAVAGATAARHAPYVDGTDLDAITGAWRALAAQGVAAAAIAARLATLDGAGLQVDGQGAALPEPRRWRTAEGSPPFAEGAARAVDRAVALAAGGPVAAVHLLVGAAGTPGTAAARLLADLGVDVGAAAAEL
jgi:hypothetical protein